MPAIISLFLVLSNAALASTPSPGETGACGNAARLSKEVNSCEANAALALAALHCTVKVSSQARRVAHELLEKMDTQAAAQSGSLSGHRSNLIGADRALEEIEGKNELAIRETLLLFLNLIHPDELYEIPAGSDPNALLRASPCYRDNKRKLLIALTELERNKAGIKEARVALKGLNAKTGSEIRLLLSTALGPVRASRARGAVVTPQRSRPVNGESDITGLRHKARKTPQ